jgi:hypothetical protein
MLLFSEKIALHITRAVRWDSDHVVLLDDETKEIAKEIVSNNALDRTFIATDYFDASINRICAWVTGVRSVQKALLLALLTPNEMLKTLQDETGFLTMSPDMASFANGKLSITTDIRFPATLSKEEITDRLQSGGVEYEVKELHGGIPLVASRPLMARVSRVCEEIGLDPHAVPDVNGNSGAEDVSYMMYRVQEHGGEATYMGIYTTLDGSQHNSSFNFGEKVLVNGVKMFCSVTYDILGKEV